MSLYAFTDTHGNVQVLIDCHESQIDIQPHNQEYPLRFDVTGKVDSLQEDKSLCVNIETGEVEFRSKPVAGSPTDEELFLELRRDRDDILAASDWTQVPDAPVDQQAWAAYRQALRDLPANTTDPRNVAWPEKP